MHVPPQLICVPGHDTWQLLLTHTLPFEHAAPLLPASIPHPNVAPQ
jgi:hypothetical protein